MQPLKPEERDAISKDHPLAAPEDLDRYEQLLSMRFTQDPDRPQTAPDSRQVKSAQESQSRPTIEEELQELHSRIFRTTLSSSAAKK
jgi:hypothetical protein